MSKALLYDATLCIGCKACEQGCATENNLSYTPNLAAQETTSAYKYTAIMTRGDAFMRRLCMNCDDPTCASVCPVGALHKTALGPVTYDGNKCMGCRYCMAACPFNVPKYEWDKLDPRVRKCDMCSKRVAAGQVTACTEACPTGATKFGDRGALLLEARQRIADGGGKYHPHIYGEHEAGGTSVFMLSAVPFEAFDLTMPQEALPILTYRVLSRIPDFVGLGGVLLAGTWWITKRRAEVAAVESGPAAQRKEKEKEEESSHEA
jgi:formate dehydrogenase iron-sulfur subunit